MGFGFIPKVRLVGKQQAKANSIFSLLKYGTYCDNKVDNNKQEFHTLAATTFHLNSRQVNFPTRQDKETCKNKNKQRVIKR